MAIRSRQEVAVKSELESILTNGLSKMSLQVDPIPLLTYTTLLHKWNQTYNLTAVHSLEEMITRHLLDSLAVIPYIHGPRIADIGTGAGLPGIPLAIYFKELQFVLFESLGKKIRFLEMVVRTLKLTNVELVAGRVEDYRGPATFDTVTSRALCSLDQFIDWTKHIIADQGQWVAMKGRQPDDELAHLAWPYTLHHYQVPGLLGERCVVCIKKDTKGLEWQK